MCNDQEVYTNFKDFSLESLSNSCIKDLGQILYIHNVFQQTYLEFIETQQCLSYYYRDNIFCKLRCKQFMCSIRINCLTKLLTKTSIKRCCTRCMRITSKADHAGQGFVKSCFTTICESSSSLVHDRLWSFPSISLYCKLQMKIVN